MFRDFLTRRRSKQRKVVESGRGGGIGMNTHSAVLAPVVFLMTQSLPSVPVC